MKRSNTLSLFTSLNRSGKTPEDLNDGDEPMMRILHIDMDAFLAVVELRRHPELVGKPLVIGGKGDQTKRGVVSMASYEARKSAIHPAMPQRTVPPLFPEAVVLMVDYEFRRRSPNPHSQAF
jgi:hypothetical protein